MDDPRYSMHPIILLIIIIIQMPSHPGIYNKFTMTFHTCDYIQCPSWKHEFRYGWFGLFNTLNGYSIRWIATRLEGKYILSWSHCIQPSPQGFRRLPQVLWGWPVDRSVYRWDTTPLAAMSWHGYRSGTYDYESGCGGPKPGYKGSESGCVCYRFGRFAPNL